MGDVMKVGADKGKRLEKGERRKEKGGAREQDMKIVLGVRSGGAAQPPHLQTTLDVEESCRRLTSPRTLHIVA